MTSERCVCGLPELDPAHSKEWCFSGVTGAHEYTPKPVAAPVDQQEGQRLRFEAWFRVEYPIRGMDWLPLSNHYASSFVESHWVTWRASLASSRSDQ